MSAATNIEVWPIDKLALYPRNPRKNDAAVDRMCSSIRDLRLKAARKLGITEVPVLLCDEWTPAQVKAFRLLVNRSATWAEFDEELLALELQDLQAADYDLSLSGFDPGEIDHLLVLDDEDRANAAPPLPETPVSRPGDLWLCGKHRVLCGDATSAEAVARLPADRKPRLMKPEAAHGVALPTASKTTGFQEVQFTQHRQGVESNLVDSRQER